MTFFLRRVVALQRDNVPVGAQLTCPVDLLLANKGQFPLC